jgi:hypothetical protein
MQRFTNISKLIIFLLCLAGRISRLQSNKILLYANTLALLNFGVIRQHGFIKKHENYNVYLLMQGFRNVLSKGSFKSKVTAIMTPLTEDMPGSFYKACKKKEHQPQPLENN